MGKVPMTLADTMLAFILEHKDEINQIDFGQVKFSLSRGEVIRAEVSRSYEVMPNARPGLAQRLAQV